MSLDRTDFGILSLLQNNASLSNKQRYHAGVATWEREIMLERQREGIAKAKAASKYKGRPISIDVAHIKQLRAELGPAAIAKRLGIARSSVYRALA